MPRWDLQNADYAKFIYGTGILEYPGRFSIKDGIFVYRMNYCQAAIRILTSGEKHLIIRVHILMCPKPLFFFHSQSAFVPDIGEVNFA
jgi:hypothetical protein